jgi:hypothetical protein
VCKAVGLFKDRIDMEAHIVLRVGEITKTTKKLTVFKEEEATHWNQSFEFEGIRARDQHVEVEIWSLKKLIEKCRLVIYTRLFFCFQLSHFPVFKCFYVMDDFSGSIWSKIFTQASARSSLLPMLARLYLSVPGIHVRKQIEKPLISDM